MVFELCSAVCRPCDRSGVIYSDAGQQAQLAELYDAGDIHDFTEPDSNHSSADGCDWISVSGMECICSVRLFVSRDTDFG